MKPSLSLLPSRSEVFLKQLKSIVIRINVDDKQIDDVNIFCEGINGGRTGVFSVVRLSRVEVR